MKGGLWGRSEVSRVVVGFSLVREEEVGLDWFGLVLWWI